jgi:hypothetical protein
MTDFIDDALRILRTLPEDVQERVLQAVLDYNTAEID